MTDNELTEESVSDKWNAVNGTLTNVELKSAFDEPTKQLSEETIQSIVDQSAHQITTKEFAMVWGIKKGFKLGREAGQEWISVEDALPKTVCLATYKNSHGKTRTIKAQHIERFTVEADIDGDHCFEWDEDEKIAYATEGWYECIDNWGDFSLVVVTEGEITHWQPLPNPPEGEG